VFNFTKFTFLNQILNFTSAYLLVAHGSRDPNYQNDLQQLALLVSRQLLESLRSQQPYLTSSLTASIARTSGGLLTKPEQPLVATACLELSPFSLQEQIECLALDCISKGIKRLKIFPLFLAAGVHLREDLPREVSLARANLRGEIAIELLPHLGCNHNLGRLLQEEFDRLNCSERLLLAHGSRRQTAQKSSELLADKLTATIAYRSISPSLAERVTELVAEGATSIAIAPYFLFAGKIGEAIALEVRELQMSFPQVRLQLGEPLGATTALAKLIVEGI
jgi:sirohydrochlorin cobaltochelatase